MKESCDGCRYNRSGVDCPPCDNRYSGWTDEDQRSVKTLLDEFAMAAMAAIVGKRPYMTVSNGASNALETALMIVRSDAKGAYTIAAAMMAERARRNEMGNVKEE